jgi:transcriptional regulator with XRE-family HTH domain
MNQPELGKKILALRQAKGLTQAELAERCNLGLRTIQRIELAEVTPRSYTIKLIFSCLDYDFYNSGGSITFRDRLNFSFGWKVRQIQLYLIDLFNLKINTMKKLSVLFSIPALVIIGMLIFNGESKAQTTKQLEQTIEQFNHEFLTNFNQGNLEPILAYYREDACILPQNCCSKSCVEQNLNMELSKNYQFTVLELVDLNVDGNLGIEKGKFEIQFGDGNVKIRGMYMTEWHYENKGWKIKSEISNVLSVNPEM